MGQNSKISWCTHTFNPWIGCTKVSDGCKFCYAESLMDHRWNKVKWGPKGERQRTSKSNWTQPTKWNAAAEKAGRRDRVFCASLADVFEDRDELKPWRRELFDLVCRTPSLDWLVLTKRPGNALAMMVEAGLYPIADPKLPRPQENLWIGTSCEDQDTADVRVQELINCPAAIRFISAEPLLAPINLNPACWWRIGSLGISWVITGCESGPRRRPFEQKWDTDIQEQCRAAGVAFFRKQIVVDGKVSTDPRDWPEALRVQEFPEASQKTPQEE